MKRIIAVLCLLAFIQPQDLVAQRYRDARSYYREFGNQNRRITIKNMRYLEAVTRGDDPRKVSKFRQMVLEQVKQTKRELGRVGAYKEDDVLNREFMAALDLYIDAFENGFGKADELTANQYNSYEDLLKYHKAAEEAELQMIDAAYKIEAAEDYFAKTYQVDLRRDSAMLWKMERLDRCVVYTRKLTEIFFRVDAELRSLFKAVDADSTDNLSVIITDLRKAVRTAQSELEEVEEFDGDEGLEEFVFDYLEQVNASIDEELRPMAETFEFQYKDQDDLADAKDQYLGYKDWHAEMNLEFKEVKAEVVTDYLEEEYYE